MDNLIQRLTVMCRDGAKRLIPDIELDCWTIFTVELCDEAIAIWECLKSDLGIDSAQEVDDILACMRAVANQCEWAELKSMIDESQYLCCDEELMRLLDQLKPMEVEIRMTPSPTSSPVDEEEEPTFTIAGFKYISLTQRIRSGQGLWWHENTEI